jgi:ubiquinone/menaquinone biosynthesis C-methylase UbiE
MPDVYANITQASPAMLEGIANTLELRATLPQYQSILKAYLAEVSFPAQARVLEVGCGTGAVVRLLAGWPNVGDVVGVDPSSGLLEKARVLSAHLPTVLFQEADGNALPFPAASFDVVVLHTVLTHVPRPEGLLAEVFRVVRPHGSVAVGDGDFSTTTVAIRENDPLQSCAASFVEHFVHDPWLVHRLSALVRAADSTLLPCAAMVSSKRWNPN